MEPADRRVGPITLALLIVLGVVVMIVLWTLVPTSPCDAADCSTGPMLTHR